MQITIRTYCQQCNGKIAASKLTRIVGDMTAFV